MTNVRLHGGTIPESQLSETDASRMWKALGSHYMAIVEFRVAERTEPADEDETEPFARLKVTRLELARGDHDEEQMRQALAVRYRARTAIGTLDESAAQVTRDENVPGNVADALLDLVNEAGEVGGYPAKATLTNGNLTIDVDTS